MKSQITLSLRKSLSVNCRRYLTGETHCAPISSPVVQCPSAVIPKNRCCKSIPRWLYFASTLSGGSTVLWRDLKGALWVPPSVWLQQEGAGMIKVHHVLLLISAGKGVPVIALNRGWLLPERAGPGLCVYNSMRKCVFWEQPILPVRLYEHTKPFKWKRWSVSLTAQIFVISDTRYSEVRSLSVQLEVFLCHLFAMLPFTLALPVFQNMWKDLVNMARNAKTRYKKFH